MIPGDAMREMRLLVENEQAMQALAARFAEAWQQTGCPCGLVALIGDVGAGKSTFSRAFIRRLMQCDTYPVPSPTFTLVQPYQPEGTPEVWHVDLYRLESEDECYELGMDEAFATHLLLVEWPEKILSIAPLDMLTIRLETVAGGEAMQRQLMIHATGAMRQWFQQVM